MKFIAFLECESDDLDDLIEIWNRRIKAGHTVKTLFPPHSMANTPKGYSGFTIFESESEDEIMHYVTEYGQVANVTITPIWESKKSSDLHQRLDFPMKKSKK